MDEDRIEFDPPLVLPTNDFEEALAPVVLMLSRIYDLLTIIADSASDQVTTEMINIHSKGGFFGPPPSFDPQYQQERDRL